MVRLRWLSWCQRGADHFHGGRSVRAIHRCQRAITPPLRTHLCLGATCNAWLLPIGKPWFVALTVLIVDDSRQFLDASSALLGRGGLEVVGVAATIADAVERAAQLRPDIVLVDIHLSDESGFDLARRLHAGTAPGEHQIILMSTHAETDFADLIAASPVAGFVPKDALSAGAIRRVLADP